MHQRFHILNKSIFFFLLVPLLGIVAGCQAAPDPTPQPEADIAPAPTAEATPEATRVTFPQDPSQIEYLTVVVDAPSRTRTFTDINEYGEVQGFDAGIISAIAATAGFDIEFIVTDFQTVPELISNGEFDALMASGNPAGSEPPAGLAYTQPYLEIGQVLMVRANETDINSYQDLPSTAVVGVENSSFGEQTAREIMGWPSEQINLYAEVWEALQALIDEEIDGVVLDSPDAASYSESYYQQLKIAGIADRSIWINEQAYRIGVAAENQVLLNLLNDGIEAQVTNGTVDTLTDQWLVSQERLIAGESLIGTLDREFVVGMVATELNLDPAAPPDTISWEIKNNIMSGLVGFNVDNQLVPLLASELPLISPDGLEYTFRLRNGLTFPDGSALTAEDVVFSLRRSVSAGNFLVNAVLKDANIDGFADDDAVQAIDDLTVRLILDEPTSYFLSILASPPYFVVSDECFSLEISPNSRCGGIGPYEIADWEPRQQMRLTANPNWPGTPQAIDNIQLRFYDDAGRMRRAIENEAIDLAWLGLPLDDLRALQDSGQYTLWEGPAAFKSYLVFQQEAPPWNNPAVRRAAGFALDREALSAIFEGSRLPLYSPVPDQVPGHTPTESERDLERAIELLEAAGYSAENRLSITIDYVNDGRYSALESEYAAEIERQLEETGIFQVTVTGDNYDAFRQRSVACESEAFILGWPPSGQPPYYNDPYHWINFFIFNTDTLCSNFESLTMDTAIASLERLTPDDFAAREAAYERIQRIWADELPTLDLTQEIRLALSLSKVTQVGIDANGMLRYDTLSKN
ncbi:MAG: ABC transporter substrate-binding protein [Ardenticatenaceae bacterium]|nr:ABC transporter substrate-binding protein [Ardenticatenaceae bacterium]